jgi:hypothetical protein
VRFLMPRSRCSGLLKVFTMCPTYVWVDRARLIMTLTRARQARLPSP